MIPFKIDKVREIGAILDDLKELLPTSNKKMKSSYLYDKPKNPYVLRSLSKLPLVETQNQRFQHKMENAKEYMAVYEQLQIKPTMNYLRKSMHSDNVGHLTDRTRNQFVLQSKKTDDPKFTATFYNNRDLKVQPLAFKNDIARVSPHHNLAPNNPEDSVIS